MFFVRQFRVSRGIAAAVVAAALAAGVALAAPAAVPATPDKAAAQCSTEIVRTEASGTLVIGQATTSPGQCRCQISTGPEGSQSLSLERRIKALQNMGQCADSGELISSRARFPGAGVAAAAAGSTFSGGSIAAASALALHAGAAVATNVNDSPGS